MTVKRYKIEDGKLKYLGSREDGTEDKGTVLEITAEVEVTYLNREYFKKREVK